jgi:hypothetical protein
MTFDEAKKKVAEGHSCDTWQDLFTIADSVGADLDIFYREVSELMAHSAANEAVREDRERMVRILREKHEGYSQLIPAVNLIDHIESLPLPHPDAK